MAADYRPGKPAAERSIASEKLHPGYEPVGRASIGGFGRLPGFPATSKLAIVLQHETPSATETLAKSVG
jgi:hypothetical protein